MNMMKWVLFDRTKGATTQDGKRLTAEAMRQMAEAVQAQINEEFAAEWGAQAEIRIGTGASDVKRGEWAFIFVPTLPDAPGASAYHDITDKGVPYAFCAVETCGSLLGRDGISVDLSHEILETFGDESANLYAYDNAGVLHAMEMCDAVEMQTYAKQAKDGTPVQVSNWLLRSWFMMGTSGPYEYMSLARLPGAVQPAGPLKTARGHGGNYQIVGRWNGATHDVHARDAAGAAEQHLEGVRHKGMVPHWSSRTALRLSKMARTDPARAGCRATCATSGRTGLPGSPSGRSVSPNAQPVAGGGGAAAQWQSAESADSRQLRRKGFLMVHRWHRLADRRLVETNDELWLAEG